VTLDEFVRRQNQSPAAYVGGNAALRAGMAKKKKGIPQLKDSSGLDYGRRSLPAGTILGFLAVVAMVVMGFVWHRSRPFDEPETTATTTTATTAADESKPANPPGNPGYQGKRTDADFYSRDYYLYLRGLLWVKQQVVGTSVFELISEMHDNWEMEPTETNWMVTLGNMFITRVEQHMKKSTLPGAQVDRKDIYNRSIALVVAVDNFYNEAIKLDRHFGALYSRAIALKLYPTVLYRDPLLAAEQANQDLCDSQIETLKAAEERVLRKTSQVLLDGTAKCVGNKINVPSNWADEENIRLTTLHSYGAWEEGGESAVSFARISKRAEDRPIIITGMDAVIHDIPIFPEKQKDGNGCSFYRSHCYAALWRQFQKHKNISWGNSRHFSRLAMVAHFSGGQYYHWFADGLPRLIALAEETKRSNTAQGQLLLKIPLLLPSLRGAFPFIADSIELLRASSPNSWPFDPIIYHDDRNPETADELDLIHWTPPDSPGGAMLTPPGLLRAVPEKLLKSSGKKPQDHLIFVSRGRDEPRYLSNEDEIEPVLKQMASEAKMKYVKFDGRRAGIRGALRMFPKAALVVGVHGAGLTNIMFSSPGAALIEISLPEPEFEEFSHIASAMDIEYASVPTKPGLFESCVNIDPKELSMAIESTEVWKASSSLKDVSEEL
jgi:capsular polysaccharide biosynthesis protein